MIYIKRIFIVFSSTPYKMGKFIRFCTGEKYNHVSISFDENLSEAYTFARRNINTPFYGGLVRDCPARYIYKNRISSLTVCALSTDDYTYENIRQICRKMYFEKEKYIYNFFSAFSAVIHKNYPIKNAYTCVEFCVRMLSIADSRIDAKKYFSPDTLFSLFAEDIFADFTLSEETYACDGYFDKIKFLSRIYLTCTNFYKLFKRNFY